MCHSYPLSNSYVSDNLLGNSDRIAIYNSENLKNKIKIDLEKKVIIILKIYFVPNHNIWMERMVIDI